MYCATHWGTCGGGGGGRVSHSMVEGRGSVSVLKLFFSFFFFECCFTSSETVGLLGTGAQDGHLNFTQLLSAEAGFILM